MGKSDKGELMKKAAGLWIDHRKAVIVFLTSDGKVTKEIESKVEKQPGRKDGVRSNESFEAWQVPADDRRQNSFTQHLNKYYDEVVASIRDVDSILIMGPGEAKGELKKRIEKHKPAKKVITLETDDKMTDKKIEAKVREYFRS